MGFDYLDGKLWRQITRDERFFCQRLYELINVDSPIEFVKYLNDTINLTLSTEEEWEVGFELCFYRDLWHYHGKKGELFSPQRTFDLCLFGEDAIIIIEAKAAQGFDHDQNTSFELDVDAVRNLTGVDNVQLIGLCSSKHEIESSTLDLFEGKIIKWKDLAKLYNDDEILLRADDVYEYSKPFSKRGQYSDRKLSGIDLVKSFHEGNTWWVGRGRGGLNGDLIKNDILSGRWKTQMYEVNTISEGPPSRNYFSLEEFVKSVGEG